MTSIEQLNNMTLYVA